MTVGQLIYTWRQCSIGRICFTVENTWSFSKNKNRQHSERIPVSV